LDTVADTPADASLLHCFLRCSPCGTPANQQRVVHHPSPALKLSTLIPLWHPIRPYRSNASHQSYASLPKRRLHLFYQSPTLLLISRNAAQSCGAIAIAQSCGPFKAPPPPNSSPPLWRIAILVPSRRSSPLNSVEADTANLNIYK
jgi:hypothetical protein